MSKMNDMNHQISNAFDEIVTTLSSAEELDSKAVEQQFQILLEQITDLEESNKSLFYYCRHHYHTLRLSYFQRINNVDKVTKEENMLAKYATLSQQFPVPEVAVDYPTGQQHLNDDSENHDHTVVSSWEDVHSQIASLTDLPDVNEIVIVLQRVRMSLESLIQGDVRTLDEYLKLQQNCTTILSAFEALKIAELHEAIEDVESNSNYLDSITDLIDFVTNRLENRQAYFANVLLSDPSRLKELLFHGVSETKQCIKRRYYEWALIFHSDKHRSNPIFDELMKHINIIRDQYLFAINSQLTKKEEMQHELDEGHKHYQLSRAYKERCERMNDPDYSVAQLKRHILTESLWAFEHYRAALKCLGKMKNESSEADIFQRVEILTYMALMMHQAGNHDIEAQLYIIAGIYIITLSTITTRLQEKLRDLQETLERYQQSSTNTTTVNVPGQASMNTTSRELVLCTNKTATARQIHDETQVFVRETILRQCVLRSAQPADLSTEITQRTLEKETFATLNSPSRMIFPILTGSPLKVGVSFGAYYVNKLLHKFTLVKRKEKPTIRDLTPDYGIRKTLNEIMKTAVDHYNHGRNAEFIDSLSQPYYRSDRLMAITRGSETIGLEIRVDQFIEPLLKHGFRADKVAHLLVLVGEVLLRGLSFSDPKRRNPEYTALLEQSKILFQGVYDSEALRTAAQDLDNRVERYHHAIFSLSAAKFFHSISSKDIKDSLDAPFVNRLNGYCRLARFNYAISCLLAAGKIILPHLSTIDSSIKH